MCGKCSAALPLRILVTMAGLLLIVAGCVDFAMKVSFTDVFINSYLILFGMLIVCLEWNKSCWNEWIQRKTFYWAIFMSRLWGRSFFYFFLAVLCCSDTSSTPKIIIGVFVFLVVFVMYFVGQRAAGKLKRLNNYLSKGTEGQERIEKLQQKYKEII
eukprot:UN31515